MDPLCTIILIAFSTLEDRYDITPHRTVVHPITIPSLLWVERLWEETPYPLDWFDCNVRIRSKYGHHYICSLDIGKVFPGNQENESEIADPDWTGHERTIKEQNKPIDEMDWFVSCHVMSFCNVLSCRVMSSCIVSRNKESFLTIIQMNIAIPFEQNKIISYHFQLNEVGKEQNKKWIGMGWRKKMKMKRKWYDMTWKFFGMDRIE